MGAETGKEVIMVRTLTLEDRRKIELMWRRNASPVKIAAGLYERAAYTGPPFFCSPVKPL